eukprot:766190-Hanusia_phi.AAC.4
MSYLQERVKELESEVQCLMEASKDYEKRYKLAEQDLAFAKEREDGLAARESELKASLSGTKIQLEQMEEEKRLYLVERKLLSESYHNLVQGAHDVEVRRDENVLV